MNHNDILTFARSFADISHTEAGTSYDGKPYVVHLNDVVDVLLRFGETDKSMLAAGYLHDVIEDVGVSPATIKDLFGDRVCELVSALTDEPGVNRKERKAKTYPKIKAIPGATQLKLADRIANVENSIRTNNKRMFLMYSKENKEFEANLRSLNDSDVVCAMWKHLDTLFSNRVESPKF